MLPMLTDFGTGRQHLSSPWSFRNHWCLCESSWVTYLISLMLSSPLNPSHRRVVHQTLTAQKLIQASICLVGEPTAEQSWFPGYCWTIAYCSRCFNHLGWRFTAENPRLTVCNDFWSPSLTSNSSHSLPRGLRRSAVSCELRPAGDLNSSASAASTPRSLFNLLFSANA
jgi:hypothetical protein